MSILRTQPFSWLSCLMNSLLMSGFYSRRLKTLSINIIIYIRDTKCTLFLRGYITGHITVYYPIVLVYVSCESNVHPWAELDELTKKERKQKRESKEVSSIPNFGICRVSLDAKILCDSHRDINQLRSRIFTATNNRECVRTKCPLVKFLTLSTYSREPI